MPKTNFFLLTLCALFLTSTNIVFSQTNSKTQDEKMAWWREARFGMFVHWGPYAIWGGEYHGHKQKRGGAEWIMNRCKIGVSEYKVVASQFNPTNFNADSLVLLAKNTGMKYLVFTSKHHDGFAMFKSNYSKFNIVDYTPYNKDILKEVAQSCRKYGIKLGIYYSQSQDWNNPGGVVARKDMSEGWANPDSSFINDYTKKNGGHWDYLQMTSTFDEYIKKVAVPQIKELLSNYGDIATFWFDTPMNITKEQAQAIMDAFAPYPQVIINDRLRRPDFLGDFRTSEQQLPGNSLKDSKDIETCMTMNGTWGYNRNDNKWKSPETIIETLISATSKGGNFLLNVGPQPDGRVPQGSIDALHGVGDWMKVNSDAIYGTVRSNIGDVEWGKIALKQVDKHSELFLFIFKKDNLSQLTIPSSLKIKNISWLASGQSLQYKSDKGQTSIDISKGEKELASLVPVIKIVLNNKLDEFNSNMQNHSSQKIVDE